MEGSDIQARRMVDEFFDAAQVRREDAHARWRDHDELDAVTVMLLRLWAANRALAALSASPAVARPTAVVERHALERWLHSRGLVTQGGLPSDLPKQPPPGP
ncbi:hypothetical protein ACL02U_02140 [Streptomyces sp. MS06]|uniref:hypothetical protein n=1 Tax=Streptomyces sp. MS06 TaxID=3385974 RepID=UPI0039A3EDEE